MDEPAALEMLRRCGSVAAGIYRRLGLTWVVIKGALKALADTRETQGVLCGVARAGKFKYSEEAGPPGDRVWNMRRSGFPWPCTAVFGDATVAGDQI